MGVPLIIHFGLGFSIINRPAIGYLHLCNLHTANLDLKQHTSGQNSTFLDNPIYVTTRSTCKELKTILTPVDSDPSGCPNTSGSDLQFTK